MNIIQREFYSCDTIEVSKNLLGQILVRETDEGITSGIIVETEAYLGEKDPAAHSYKGRSDRVRAMYGDSGCAYIYLIYGMYQCFNITSGKKGLPEAILIRALEPIDGVDLMKKRRNTDKITNLCSGPGKLCMAMDIGKSLYGCDLTDRKSGLWIECGNTIADSDIIASKRINIDYAGEAKDYLWRFTVKDSKFISAKIKF